MAGSLCSLSGYIVYPILGGLSSTPATPEDLALLSLFSDKFSDGFSLDNLASLGIGWGNVSLVQMFNLKVGGVLLLEGVGALSLCLFSIQKENYDFTVQLNKYNQDLHFSICTANECTFKSSNNYSSFFFFFFHFELRDFIFWIVRHTYALSLLLALREAFVVPVALFTSKTVSLPIASTLTSSY